MAETATTTAEGSSGDKLLGDIFENCARLRVPPGATRLDLGVDLDRGDGSPGVHVKLSIQADLTPRLAAMTAGVPEPKSPEVLFGPKGHGAIVVIAMKDIEAHRPDIKAKIDEILANDPKGRTDYFSAANWADHIKFSRPSTRPWHFIDIPYDPRSSDATPPFPDPPHVLSQLVAMTDEVSRRDDPEEKADALCFVLHFLGDIHQPLHCITRITPPHFPAPKGDEGGNLFKLSGPYKELHSLWDDSVNLGLQDNAEELAAEIMKKHPRGGLARALAVNEPEAWVRESYAIAVEHGYRPLEGSADDVPHPQGSYLRKARDIGQRQAALAGYRLSDWLTEMLREKAGSTERRRSMKESIPASGSMVEEPTRLAKTG